MAYRRVTVSVIAARREEDAERTSLRDGSTVVVRPLELGDIGAIESWFRGLEPGTPYARFLGSLKRLDPATLAELAGVDHRRHEAIAAIAPDGATVGIARFIRYSDSEEAEVAVPSSTHGRVEASLRCSLRTWRPRRALSGYVVSRGPAWRQTVRCSGCSDGLVPRRSVPRMRGWSTSASICVAQRQAARTPRGECLDALGAEPPRRATGAAPSTLMCLPLALGLSARRCQMP